MYLADCALLRNFGDAPDGAQVYSCKLERERGVWNSRDDTQIITPMLRGGEERETSGCAFEVCSYTDFDAGNLGLLCELARVMSYSV